MTDIGIVIVTYNSEREIGACLDAALATGAEVIVVDNASRDGTVAEATRRGVRVDRQFDQRGFAAAVNQGFGAMRSSLCTAAQSRCGARRIDRAAAGGLREGRGGARRAAAWWMQRAGRKSDSWCGRFPTPAALILEVLLLNRIWPGNPVNRRYRELELDYSRRLASGTAGGRVFDGRDDRCGEELGGFDEEFFPALVRRRRFLPPRGRSRISFATTCRRLSRNIREGIPSRSLTVEMRRVYWYGSLLRYSAKHFRPIAFRVVCLAVVSGFSYCGWLAEAVRTDGV